RKVHLVRETGRTRSSDEELIRSQVRRDSRRKRDQLRKVASVNGKLADLCTGYQPSRSRSVQIHRRLRSLHCDNLVGSADLQLDVYRAAVVDVKYDIVRNIFLKAGGTYCHLVVPDGQSGGDV